MDTSGQPSLRWQRKFIYNQKIPSIYQKPIFGPGIGGKIKGLYPQDQMTAFYKTAGANSAMIIGSAIYDADYQRMPRTNFSGWGILTLSNRIPKNGQKRKVGKTKWVKSVTIRKKETILSLFDIGAIKFGGPFTLKVESKALLLWFESTLFTSRSLADSRIIYVEYCN